MTEAQIAAIAGEHYVAHKIAMLGFVPTLVRQRVPRIDLLVSSASGEKTVGIQIKSAFNATREPDSPAEGSENFVLRFPLGHRAITSSTENTFFCFVDLRRQSPSALPDVYVVSANVLKQEYEGVYLRKYSQVHYQRPWRAMQPFRNNWDPIERALTSAERGEATAPRFQPLPFPGVAQRYRDGLVFVEPRHSAGR